MNLFEDTNPRALKDLLSEIHSRIMALPNFQRDFVWEPGATQELIVSIANNYPAGSILRVRDAKEFLPPVSLRARPHLMAGNIPFSSSTDSSVLHHSTRHSTVWASTAIISTSRS